MVTPWYIMAALVAAAPPALRITHIESDIHAFEDRAGKARPATCMMIAKLENRAAEPIDFVARPVVVQDESGATVGRCEYKRALVRVESDKAHIAFTLVTKKLKLEGPGSAVAVPSELVEVSASVADEVPGAPLSAPAPSPPQANTADRHAVTVVRRALHRLLVMS